jgi:hypothetical protein
MCPSRTTLDDFAFGSNWAVTPKLLVLDTGLGKIFSTGASGSMDFIFKQREHSRCTFLRCCGLCKMIVRPAGVSSLLEHDVSAFSLITEEVIHNRIA